MTLTYRFHCAPQAHFSHDRVDVTYEQLPIPTPKDPTLMASGTRLLALHGKAPSDIKVEGQWQPTMGERAEVDALCVAVLTDRAFIPALLRAKQAEIEKELAISQRRVEKLLTARDKLRALTAE